MSNSESRWIWKVLWDGCLARTFGSTLRVLSGLSQILGSYLGSTARIYSALAIGEPNVAQAETESPTREAIRLGKFEVKALATESNTYCQLRFHYKVLLPNGFVIHIQPGLFSDHLLERTGVLSCYRGKRYKQILVLPCSTVQSGWAVQVSDQSLHCNAGIAMCLLPCQQDIARCVAFTFQSLRNVFCPGVPFYGKIQNVCLAVWRQFCGRALRSCEM